MEKHNHDQPNHSDILTLANIIKNAKSLVFFGGAGVSTESGIPDFRSVNGIYQQPNTYEKSPEYLLSHTCFQEQPQAFFDFYFHEMIHTEVKPNQAHKALAKLEAMGLCDSIITQNIDGLHQMAGSIVVYELHGSVHHNRCQTCNQRYSLTHLLELRKQSQATSGFIPLCHCGGIIKPDVVLYEEALSEVVMNKAIEAIRQADVLIVGGTSLRVYPAAGFLHYFQGKHLILINQDLTSFDHRASLMFRQPIGDVMGAVMTLLPAR